MGKWFQRLVASSRYGAVSDATIRGYLRSASQLEEVWQQIDEKVDDLILQGLPPWEAFASLGYALAFLRACRLNVVCVQELLKASAATGAASAGQLAKVTNDQALALCEQFEPLLEEAIKASAKGWSPRPGLMLPLQLGPRIDESTQSPPVAHVRGLMGAAQEMKGWTSGLLAKYELALNAAPVPVPQEVSGHLEHLKSELELGDFHLRAGA